MKRQFSAVILGLVAAIGLTGCVVLDERGHVDSGATAVANGLLIGAGVIGLGIAALEADHHRHHPVREVVICDHCGTRGHHHCRVTHHRRY